MPSIQQILDYVDRKFYSSETDANKVIDLDGIHKKVYVKINRLKNRYESSSITTIADQLTYSLPSDCLIENIISVQVSASATITSSIEWDEYKYAGLNDGVESGNYYGVGGEGLITLLSDGLPITIAGLTIMIYYYKTPASLSSSNLSAIPELDSYYHDLLKYGLIQELASQGHNADTEIADYWQRKFDEFMAEVESNLAERYNSAPTQSHQAEEWW